ncbi:MAG: hypothetical protein NTZ53_07690 [Cyanobacteria bacterium]|nr:hypothetical protein [Cyanobacteriota bacterium]
MVPITMPPLAAPLRSELPYLAVQALLLVVVLHANAPEVWFWYGLLWVLLIWRGLAWRTRWLESRAGAPPAAQAGEQG